MSKLRAGDWVEVRSKEEILRTLDKTGRLDDLPFMPQMFQHCGQRFKVFKRAHKTCDTIVGIPPGRRMPDGIHLNLRCDGKAYGGCQAACLIYWKETWLKSVNEGERPAPRAAGTGGCSEEDVERATRVDELKVGGEPRYACQATEVLNFTTPLPWWDARQYVEDYTSGNTTLLKMLRGFLYVGYFYGTLAFSQRFGGPARWLYDRFQTLWGGFPFPRHRGTLSAGQPEPRASLNLQPGDWVRVKPYEAILATLNSSNKNRGMLFDAEMMPYCARTFRVRGRVEKFIDEKTGYMKRMKTPAVILEGVICRSRYSSHRMFCPRAIYSWWREIWLEPVLADPQLRIDEDIRERPRCDVA